MELAKPQAPDLVSLLNAYYTQRRAGAYSQKGKVSNLKEMNETFNYLRANGIYSLEDLEHRVSEHSATTESLKKTLDEQTARMKAIKQLYDSSAAFQRGNTDVTESETIFVGECFRQESMTVSRFHQ